MIGSRARYSDHVFVRLFSWEAIMVLACQVGPFHLTLTQINSEINCIAKNKCPESQKLDARRRSENMIAISPRVTKSNNIVCTHYVKMFCILCLCIILYDTSKAPENLTFVLKQSPILSILTLSGWHSFTWLRGGHQYSCFVWRFMHKLTQNLTLKLSQNPTLTRN